MNKLCLLSAAWVLLANVAHSEVVDIPSGPYGSGFRDQVTGKTWLDVSNFREMRYDQIVAALADSPFRLATRSEVEALFSTLSLSGTPYEAMGTPTRCAIYDCHSGAYDDSATGTDPHLSGIGSVDWTLSPPTSPVFVTGALDDQIDPQVQNRGAWVIQRSPSLCPSSDTQSLDMDCDGIDEKVVWRNNWVSWPGYWFIRFSRTNELLAEQWGLPGDYPIMGDYDGDRIPDLVVWRNSDGNWYIKTSSTLFDRAQARVIQFGLPGDVPLRGDYDGDAILDCAVWRPSDGNFYIRQSSTGQMIVQQWGLSGDIPLSSARNISPQ